MEDAHSIEDFLGDGGFIGGIQQVALLSRYPKEGLVKMLWEYFKDKPTKMIGGFHEDDRLYLHLQSSEEDHIYLDVCSIPKEYEDKPVKKIRSFDKEYLRKILLMQNTPYGPEHYLNK